MQSMSVERAGLAGSGAATPTARVRWSRYIYLTLAWVFVACVVYQVFLAGMAVFVDSLNWGAHTSFIHAFEFVPLPMLLFVFLGRLPVAARWLTGLLIVLIFAQYATANIGGVAGAFHPVNALLITWVAIFLGQSAWRAVRQRPAAGSTPVEAV